MYVFHVKFFYIIYFPYTQPTHFALLRYNCTFNANFSVIYLRLTRATYQMGSVPFF